MEIVEFSPKYEKKYPISIAALILILPLFWYMIFTTDHPNKIIVIIGITMFTSLLIFMPYRIFKRIQFFDNRKQLRVIRWFVPDKTINYSSIKEVSLYAIHTNEFKIVFVTLKNAEDLIRLIEERKEFTSINIENQDSLSNLSETDKEIMQLQSIKYAMYSLPIIVLISILFDIGIDTDLFIMGSFILVMLIAYLVLKRKHT